MEPMFDVFTACVNEEISLTGGVSKLLELHATMDSGLFQKAMTNCICKILVKASEGKKMYRALEMLIDFMTSPEIVKRIHMSALDDSDFDVDQVFYTIMQIILHYHKATGKMVRFHVCHIIRRVLESLPSDIELESGFLDELSSKLRERIHDLVVNIRLEAVQAISRIQDPFIESCPIIEDFTKVLALDLSEKVRCAAATNVCITNKSIPHIIDRVHDKKPVVRKVIYERLSKYCPIRVLTIEQRVKVINAGLLETEKEAKQKFCNLLVDSWFLNSCEGDLNVFIDLFDIEEDYEFLSRAVTYILKNLSSESFEKLFNTVFKTESEDIENLYTNPDAVFIYCRMLNFILTNNDRLTRYGGQLPEICKICQMIEQTMRINSKSLILSQWFSVLRNFELNDEAGRRSAVDLALKMLSKPNNMNLKVVVEVVKTYVHFATNHDRTLDTTVELISEIRQPMNSSCIFSQTTQKTDENTQNNESVEIVITCLSIISEILKVRTLDLSTPSATSLLQSFILPLIQDSRVEVRSEAVLCLSLFCIYVKSYAVQYFVLLTNIVKFDVSDIKKIAISAIFDILTLYGVLEIEQNMEESEQTIVDMLLDYYSDDWDAGLSLIMIAGLSKLLLFKRTSSAKAFSFLILSILNPSFQSDQNIQFVISQFFQRYLTDRFYDTFQTVVDGCILSVTDQADQVEGSSTSINNMVNLFSNLTDVKTKVDPETSKPSLREKLVLALMERIIVSESNCEIRLIIKILSSFTEFTNTPDGADESHELIEKVMSKLTEQDRRTLRLAQNIKTRLLNTTNTSVVGSTKEHNSVIGSTKEHDSVISSTKEHTFSSKSN